MFARTLLSCWFVAAACAASLPARADSGIGVDVLRGDYTAVERLANGAIANRESGQLEGQRLDAWWQQPPWRVGVRLGRIDGTIAYRGRSQIGFPVRTRTRLGIDEASLQGSWSAAATTDLDVALTAGLGIRRIDRRIAASLFSTPLDEVLTWRYAQLGAQARWRFADNWFATAGAQLEHGLGARLAVDFHGVADPVTLHPGHGRIGHQVELQLGRALGRHSTLVLRASQGRQPYGGSPSRPFSRSGQTVGQVRYPGSVQTLNTIGLRLDVQWK